MSLEVHQYNQEKIKTVVEINKTAKSTASTQPLIKISLLVLLCSFLLFSSVRVWFSSFIGNYI